MIVAYDKNSHTVKVSNLKDASTGLFINSGAVVRLSSLVDESGAAVADPVFPVTLTAVPATATGEWTAAIAPLTLVVVGRRYFVILEVNPGAEPRGYAKVALLVEERII